MSSYRDGVEDAIAVAERRASRVGNAINARAFIPEVREELLNERILLRHDAARR